MKNIYFCIWKTYTILYRKKYFDLSQNFETQNNSFFQKWWKHMNAIYSEEEIHNTSLLAKLFNFYWKKLLWYNFLYAIFSRDYFSYIVGWNRNFKSFRTSSFWNGWLEITTKNCRECLKIIFSYIIIYDFHI